MKHLSQAPAPPSVAARRRSRATSTTSSCARSRRILPTATTRPRRWTPTSSASPAGIGVSRRDGRGGDDRARAVGLRRGGDDDPRARRRASRHDLRAGAAYYDYDEPPPQAHDLAMAARGRARRAARSSAAGSPTRQIQDQLSGRQAGRRARRRRPPRAAAPSQKIRDAGLKELVAARAERRRHGRATSSEQDPQPGDRTAEGQLRHDRRLDRAAEDERAQTSSASSGTEAVSDLAERGPESQRRSSQLAPARRTRSLATGSEGRAPSWSKGRRSASTSRRGRSRSRCRTWSGSASRARSPRRSRARASRSRADRTSTIPQPPERWSGRIPPPATHAEPKGSTITLRSPKGPQTSQVPDVTSLTERGRARAADSASGFKVQVVDGDRRRPEPGRTRARPGPGGRHRRGAGHDGASIVVGRVTSRREATARRRPRPRPRPSVSRRIRVAVVAGGRSSEHEISLASARSVLEALDPERYETTSRSRSAATAAGSSRAQVTAC